MAARKPAANKAEKATPANKSEKIESVAIDWSKSSYDIEAIVDSKHMKKGQVFKKIGALNAKLLVERGLVKVV